MTATENKNMNTISINKRRWSAHAWERKGEHWSDGWGNSQAQWLFSIYPRIALQLPAVSVVEIATGYGRWTKLLKPYAQSYVGFDLVEKCAAYCQEQYGAANARFTANDGLHLIGVEDHSVDFVYSFDSLVHVDWPTLSSYLSEIIRVLRDGGSAFIHHSNAADVPGFNELTPPGRKGYRANDVSALIVRKEVEKLGGGVYCQEIIDWGGSGPNALIDCLTTIVTHSAETVVVENSAYMLDMRRISKIAGLYATEVAP